MSRRRLAACLIALPTLQSGPLQIFRNLNNSFHVELPADWRQLAPNEASQISRHAAAPRPLTFAQPRRFYAVGPVDDWLRGDFSAPWLQVVEQDQEWFVDDNFASQLEAMWRAEGETTGVRHELAGIERTKIGKQEVEVVIARRTSTASAPIGVTTSLDVHAPCGGQQLTLSFTCQPADFSRAEAEFRRWLTTLTFARIRRGSASLTDRLWTPLLTGAIVSLILLVIYKHTRGRRYPR